MLDQLKRLAPSPWLLLVVAIAVGVAYIVGRSDGSAMAEGKHNAALLDQALAYAAEIKARQSSADLLAGELEQARAGQEPRDRIITKEVLRYVEVTPSADRVLLPGTWRLRHDAAATGVPLKPGAASLSVAASWPVEDAAALETVGDNYRDCRTWRDQLIGWQRYYREVIRHGQGDHPGGDTGPAE